jgi:hypothetical protein
MAFVAAAVGIIGAWILGGSHASVADDLTLWAAAAALSVVTITAAACQDRWFHPLSLPLAALVAMFLAAPLWVYFTHEPAGLLFDNGHEPANASSLAVEVSVRTVEALMLVVAGYFAGAVAVLTLTPLAGEPATIPAFRYRDMRRAGLVLMASAAVARMAIAYLGRAAPYGTNQFQYGTTSILGPAAEAALLTGMILVTLVVSRTSQPRRFRDLMLGREWAALSANFLAVAAAGHRGALIAPAVYLAWTYSIQVRAIRIKWLVAGALVAITAGAVISNHRQGGALSPGSPAVIMQETVGAANSSAWITEQTVARVPSVMGYLHGSTYVTAAEAQLPGPVARRLGATSRTASAVFRNMIGFYNPNQGFAESYASEAYLNFGLPGCLGAGLFLGALAGWSWRKYRAPASRPRNLLYPVLLAGLVVGLRSDALTQIKDVLYPMLAASVLLRWYRLPGTTCAAPIPAQEAAARR